ncbi:MAG TPA: thioredoxin-disulfide reductase [Dehalococcoidia bacterium]|nr:thioredoxin-disulfide reductase [Dehalococcoidia bacterium]
MSDPEPATPPAPLYDVVIIGGGPAGLTAALYAARARRRTLVLEKGVTGGQIALTSLVENFPGFVEGTSGFALAEAIQTQAQRYGAEFRFEAVDAVARDGDLFQITVDGGALRARALLITTGAEYRRLGVPGEERLTGRGVSYCATCDAAFFRDVEVAVVGGGDAAVDEALFITRFASRVHLIHRRAELRASRILQERAFANPQITPVWNTVVEEIVGVDEVEAALLRNVETGEHSRLNVAAVFIFIGQTPATGFLRGLAPTDPGGHLLVGLMMNTPVDGVFAAGDVRTHSSRQAISAAGDGATAAIAAEQYLSERFGPPALE